MAYFLANLLLAALPPTRLFFVKRLFLQLLGIKLGIGTRVCGNVKFYGGGQVIIGSGCWIGIGTSFFTAEGASIYVGDRCDIAPEVSFMCGSHKIGGSARRAGLGTSRAIVVGCGTWIGTRSIALGGANIGDSSVVGAGSLLLNKDYPAACLILGTPARIVRRLDSAEDRSGIEPSEDAP
jgi:maltose O-acetyltransferase